MTNGYLCCISNYPDLKEVEEKAYTIFKKLGYKVKRKDYTEDPTTPIIFYLDREPRYIWEKKRGVFVRADIDVIWNKLTHYTERVILTIYEVEKDIVIELHPSTPILHIT